MISNDEGFTERGDPALRLLAWGGVALGSSLVEIVAHLATRRSPFWLNCAQVALLTLGGVVALGTKRFEPVGRFLLALAALRLCWYLVASRLGATESIQHFVAQAHWGARLFVARLLPVAGAALMCFTLIGNGLTRRDLFLRIGRMNAPAQPLRFLGFRAAVPWTVFGPALLAVFGLALPAFLYVTLRPNFAVAHRVWMFLPWILLTAAMNAANEEFQYRCVPLAHLRDVVPVREAVLLTAVLFGIGHYFGQPSGTLGVFMAGFAGWIWGKSMVETGGSAWAFLIHMVQDVVIFAFMAMAAK